MLVIAYKLLHCQEFPWYCGSVTIYKFVFFIDHCVFSLGVISAGNAVSCRFCYSHSFCRFGMLKYKWQVRWKLSLLRIFRGIRELSMLLGFLHLVNFLRLQMMVSWLFTCCVWRWMGAILMLTLLGIFVCNIRGTKQSIVLVLVPDSEVLSLT